MYECQTVSDEVRMAMLSYGDSAHDDCYGFSIFVLEGYENQVQQIQIASHSLELGEATVGMHCACMKDADMLIHFWKVSAHAYT